MKLPDWIPQVTRPWNPAWRETWKAMTPDQRRASFLMDVVICAVVVVILYLAGV